MNQEAVALLAINVDVLPETSAEAAVELLLDLLRGCKAAETEVHELTPGRPAAVLGWS